MSDLREALRELHASAKEARRLGAVAGSHWTRLDVACLKAEAALSAEPAQEMTDELTEEQIEAALKGAGIDIGLDDGTPGYRFIMMAAFNAVVAADRASRLPEITDEELRDVVVGALEERHAEWLMDDDDEMCQSQAIMHVARAVEALVRGTT